jgi:nitric oxide dioxygenase
MALSAKAVSIVKATAPVVADHALQITSVFYRTMFHNDPHVQHFFNQAHQVAGHQPRALADSIIQYATHIDDLSALTPLVARIAHRHCALSIKPEHYGIVHKNLMLAIGEVLGSAVTPEIGAGWSEAVLGLAGVCIDAEEKLYVVVVVLVIVAVAAVVVVACTRY